MSKSYFAKVVTILNDFSVVINKGSNNGIREDSRFLIVEIGENIIDPDTGKSLGLLEITKGWCKPSHIQENICTIESNEFGQGEGSTEITKTKNTMSIAFGGTSVKEVSKPGRRYQVKLKDVNVGDRIIARGIRDT